jgi:CxxC-x17-CxxC domain-containing protein
VTDREYLTDNSEFSFRRCRLRIFFSVQRRDESRRSEVSAKMSDTTITCRDCGQGFTFTAGEQAFYQERGFSEPQRCPSCRAERKAQRADSGNAGYGSRDSYGSGGSYGGDRGGNSYGGPRQLYAAVCSACGKDTEVPFQPRNDKPVYCRECFAERRPATTSYSNRY